MFFIYITSSRVKGAVYMLESIMCFSATPPDAIFQDS